MKAAVLVGKRDIQIKNIEEPILNPDEVRVRVHSCGICGSDLPRYFDGAVHGFPIVLGHEFAGTVVECGGDVKNVKVGDQVAGVPLRACGGCEVCSEGNFALCKNYRFVGSKINGAFAERVTLPANNVVLINKNTPLESAIFYETSSVALHAIDVLGNLEGETVAIIGAGTIGWLCAQWARIQGASKVIVFGRDPEAEKKAKIFGVTHYLNTNEDLDEINHQITAGKGYIKIVDAVGSSDTIKLAIKFASNHATLSLVGTPTSDINFSSQEWTMINRKELTLKGTWMGYSNPFPGSEWIRTTDALANGKLLLDDNLIYKKYQLENIKDAFELYKSGEKVRGRIVIKI